MKYVIEIFENGVRSDVLVTDNEYDWDGYYKVFHDKNNSYVNKGYRTVECKWSSSSECQYHVLFNDNEMKSAVFSAKFYTESDFIDADGQPIILSKLYRSEEIGDGYSINESPYDWKGKLYLRNVDKWNSHTETVDGRIRVSCTFPDKYDFDQKFIDSLKLHRGNDKKRLNVKNAE